MGRLRYDQTNVCLDKNEALFRNTRHLLITRYGSVYPHIYTTIYIFVKMLTRILNFRVKMCTPPGPQKTTTTTQQQQHKQQEQKKNLTYQD